MKSSLCLLIFLIAISCKEKVQSHMPQDQDVETVDGATLAFSEYIDLPITGYAHLPRLKAQGDKLHMTWVEQEDSLAILKYAYYADAKWSSPETVASGADWFVNWADFPAVAENNGTVITHFLQKSAEGTYDYDIKIVIRDSATGIWSIPQTLHNDGIPAEHGFVSFIPYSENNFLATWLDGRNTKSGDQDRTHHGHSATAGAMTLRSAQIGFDGTISNRTELDNRICDCCNTAMTMTDQGAMVLYRDRSEDENEMRDIYTTLLIEDGWTTPKPVHTDLWKINGCPVNGPAVAARGNTVVAAWFTAAADTPKVLTAFSKDGGLSFEAPIRMDTQNAVGRVDVVMLDSESAVVLWMEPDGDINTVQLNARRVYLDGHTDTTQTITTMSGERASGFPQIEIVNNKLYISWTVVGANEASIHMQSIDL